MPLNENLKPDTEIDPKLITKDGMESLAKLLSDKDNRDKIIKDILSEKAKQEPKKPVNWAKSSNPPYYRERFALQLRPHLDAMIESQEDILFQYKDFSWVSKNSLYLLLNQSFKYLLDKLDPDGKYTAFRQIISITREKDSHGNAIGIRFSIAKDVRHGGKPFIATSIKEQETWRNDMEDFIENAEDGMVFSRTQLVLSDEEITELYTFLGSFPNIISNIGPTSIKLVKSS